MEQKLSDLAIIEAIKLGSEKLLFKIYDEYRNEFIGWAMGNHQLDIEVAKDIFQNTIIAFHNNIIEDKFSGEKTSLKTYLFSIGKNQIRNHFRSTKNMGIHVELDDQDHVTVNEELNEFTIAVKEAMAKLGEHCKAILTLFYQRGFDMESIAREVGFKNRDVAKKSKYECLKKLEIEVKSNLKSA